MFKKIPPQGQLMNLILGKWISKPIYVVTKLGIADQLADGPKGVKELSEACSCHEDSLYRILRALASIDIFKETDERVFELTPIAALLQKDQMASSVLMFNSEWSDRAWDHLLESVQTGKSAFEIAFGEPVFEWLHKNPEEERIFNEANMIKARTFHKTIVNTYNFSHIGQLYDIGGGLGSLSFEVLERYPTVKATVADLPSVVAQTKEVIKEQGMEERCSTTECDFFKEVPKGGDAYMLSNILHDWTDEQCKVILDNLYEAMESYAALLVIEHQVQPGNKKDRAKFLDLEMMVSAGGKERTQEEFAELFHRSGFQLLKSKRSRMGLVVMECVKQE